MSKFSEWLQMPCKSGLGDLAKVGVAWKQERPRKVCTGIGIVILVVFYKLFGANMKHRLMAWVFAQFTKKEYPPYEAYKKKCFETLQMVKSADEELAAQNAIRILEVGIGTGTNFKYYPNNTHLVVVDSNPYFRGYYNENRAKFPNIKSEEITVSKGEEMYMIRTESTDVVVMTLVMCSVENMEKVLEQVYRVLVPGGKYFFIEHTSEWNPTEYPVRAFFQNFLTVTGIWPFLFDGCCLNRDPVPVIRKTGFQNVDIHRFYAPMPNKFTYVIHPHVYGTAVKPVN